MRSVHTSGKKSLVQASGIRSTSSVKSAFRVRAVASAAALAVSASIGHAASLYWDGATPAGDPNGGAGTWDNLSTANWDTAVVGGTASQWNNANNDTAVFGGTAGTVTLGEPINVGGLQFNTTGYGITTTGHSLNFAATNNTILFNNIAAATITGPVGGNTIGGSNVTLTAAQPTTAGTLTLSGTSAGGWSGTTTVNSNMRLEMTGNANNQALLNTSAINLKGGTIAIGGAVAIGGSQATLDRINNSAGIAVNAGGTIVYDVNNSSTNSETVGTLTLNRGQFNLTEGYSLSSGSSTFTFSGLSRTGATNASVVNLQMKNTGLSTGGAHRVVVGGVSGNTPGGEIVGPWFTTNYANAGSSDYIVYSNGGSGSTYYAIGANITASTESVWSTTHAATSNYTLTNAVGSAVNGRLTATRNINTLRNTSTASAAPTIDIANDTVTVAGSSFVDGDVVTFGGTAPGGLATGTVYYVRDVSGTTFKVAATSGGAAINITSSTATNVTGGITLSSGNNLGTYGILNGSAAALAIGRSGTGVVTLPTTASGNLYLTPSSAGITINAPIADNGSGVLTLVKSGGNLFLSGTNTYTGGTVLNAGTLTYATAANLGASGSRNITFNGTATLTATADNTLDTLTVSEGAVGTLGGSFSRTFTSATGSGTIIATGGQNKIVSLGNASTFTGDLVLAYAANNNSGITNPHLRFASLSDTAGSAIQIYRTGGGTDSGQIGQVGVYGDAGPVTFDNRQIQILSRPTTTSNPNLAQVYLSNNNATAANKWVIDTDLLNASGRDMTLGLMGSNTGNNEFFGLIGNSIYNASNPPPNGFSSGTGVLSLSKQEGGKWILSNNANTYTGATTVTGGILEVTKLADGGVASSIGASSNAASNLVFGTGARLRYVGTGDSTDRRFIINGTAAGHNAVLEASGTGALNMTSTATPGYGTVDQTRGLSLTGSNTGANTLAATLTNNGTGALSLTKLSPGRWILSGTNTYTGTTTISAGVLQAIEGSSIATNTGISLDGGVFQSNGTFTRSVGAVSTAGSTTYNMTANGGGFSAIDGKFTVNLGNTATVRNWGSTVSTSPLVGTLKFGSASSNAEVEMTNNINFNGTTRTIEVTAGVGGDFATMSGVLSNSTGTAGFDKTGTGKLVLTNTNTYNGATAVNDGTLLINGSTNAASAFTVASVGTLGGTGTIGGTVGVTGTLAPGASIESLASGALTMNNGSTFEFEAVDDSATGADLMVVNGALSLTGVTLDLTGADLDSIIWGFGDRLTLISYTGDEITSGFTGYDDDTDYVFGGNTWRLDYNDSLKGNNYNAEATGDQFVTLTVVPEPTSLALLGLGGLLLRRRR